MGTFINSQMESSACNLTGENNNPTHLRPKASWAQLKFVLKQRITTRKASSFRDLNLILLLSLPSTSLGWNICVCQGALSSTLCS